MTDDLEQLERRGRIRALCDALEAERAAAVVVPGDPYRDAGTDLDDEADRWHELGRWQWHQARLAASERSLGRALELRERLYGPSDPRTIDTLERLAALDHYLGRDRAAEAFDRVVALREATSGSDSVPAAITRRNQGACLRDRGRAGAAPLLDRACDDLARLLGCEHPEYAAALKARALLVANQDAQGWRALEHAERAYATSERAHHDEHPFVSAALLLVARAALKVRPIGEARRHAAAALAGLERGYGDDHPLVAIALQVVADGALQDGAAAEARAARVRAFETYTRTYPRSSTSMLYALRVMDTYLAEQDRDGAWPWAERAAAAADGRVARGSLGLLAEAADLGVAFLRPDVARPLAAMVVRDAAADSDLARVAGEAVAWCDQVEPPR